MELADYFPFAKPNGCPGAPVDEVVDASLSAAAPSDDPEAVFVIGPIAVGKTTFRRDKYRQGYVSLDPEDIYLALTRSEQEVPEDIADRLDRAGETVCDRAISERRNIVAELVPAEIEYLQRIFHRLRAVGYRVGVQQLACDVEEGLRRQKERSPNDISVYFTERLLLHWLDRALPDGAPGGKQ